jgi:hypothetical protein
MQLRRSAFGTNEFCCQRVLILEMEITPIFPLKMRVFVSLPGVATGLLQEPN